MHTDYHMYTYVCMCACVCVPECVVCEHLFICVCVGCVYICVCVVCTYVYTCVPECEIYELCMYVLCVCELVLYALELGSFSIMMSTCGQTLCGTGVTPLFIS